MTRTRESVARSARAEAATLSDGSVVWNVLLYDGTAVIATVGVIGGEKAAKRLADQIDRVAAWVQEGRS